MKNAINCSHDLRPFLRVFDLLLYPPIFFTEIFSAPVRGGCAGSRLSIRFSCAVARPAHGHPAPRFPGPRACAFFDQMRRTATIDIYSDSRIGSRCAASPPPPSASPHSSMGRSQILLQHPPRRPLLPFKLSTRPQNLASIPKLTLTHAPPSLSLPSSSPMCTHLSSLKCQDRRLGFSSRLAPLKRRPCLTSRRSPCLGLASARRRRPSSRTQTERRVSSEPGFTRLRTAPSLRKLTPNLLAASTRAVMEMVMEMRQWRKCRRSSMSPWAQRSRLPPRISRPPQGRGKRILKMPPLIMEV